MSAQGERRIKARRRLHDLFAMGVEIRFTKEGDQTVGAIGPFYDEHGDPRPAGQDEIAMFVRPPDPLQREQALREASAKRARTLIRAKREEGSNEHAELLAYLERMDPDELVKYVVSGHEADLEAEAEREILSLKEWEDMEQYRDAMRQFLEMPEDQREGDPEWEALLELDRKFSQQISERAQQLQESEVEAMRMLPRDRIHEKALDKRSELMASQAFAMEYAAQMKFFAVRDPESHDQLFFESVDEYLSQPELIQEMVDKALLPFISDGREAKN